MVIFYNGTVGQLMLGLAAFSVLGSGVFLALPHLTGKREPTQDQRLMAEQAELSHDYRRAVGDRVTAASAGGRTPDTRAVASIEEAELQRVSTTSPAFRADCAVAIVWRLTDLEPAVMRTSEYAIQGVSTGLIIDGSRLYGDYISGRGLGERTRALLAPAKAISAPGSHWRACLDPKFVGG